MLSNVCPICPRNIVLARVVAISGRKVQDKKRTTLNNAGTGLSDEETQLFRLLGVIFPALPFQIVIALTLPVKCILQMLQCKI